MKHLISSKFHWGMITCTEGKFREAGMTINNENNLNFRKKMSHCFRTVYEIIQKETNNNNVFHTIYALHFLFEHLQIGV